MLPAFAGVARLMRFVPRSVMIGFVNALAILMFMAQIPYLVDVPWIVYPMVAVGIAMMILLPRLTSAVPAPLVAVILITIATVALRWTVPDVGDQGELPDGLPILGIPAVPSTFGGIGGIGGCAMIGQPMINVEVSGARTRVSTFLSGVFVLLLVVTLGDLSRSSRWPHSWPS